MGIGKKLWVFAALGAGLALAGCGEKEFPEDSVNYVVIPSGRDARSEQAAEAFRQTVEEHGGNAVVKMPENDTPEAQLKILAEIREEDVDCVAISPNSSSVYQGELEEMTDRGVKLVAFDQVMQRAEGRQQGIQVCAFRVGQMGELLLSLVKEKLGTGQTQLAVLTPNSFQYNETRYVRDIRSILEAGRYPDILLTETAYTEEDEEKGREKTEYLLKRYPDIRVFLAMSTASAVAAAQYLQEKNLDGRVKVVSCAMPEAMEAYMGGVCAGNFYADPARLGRLSAYAAIALTEEGFVPEEGRTLAAGEMGNYVLEAPPTVAEEPRGLPTVYMQEEPDTLAISVR